MPGSNGDRATARVVLRIGHAPWDLEIFPVKEFDPTSYLQLGTSGFIVGQDVDVDAMVEYVKQQRENGPQLAIGVTG